MTARGSGPGVWFSLLALGLGGVSTAGGQDLPAQAAKEVAVLRGHTNAVRCLALSGDGRTLVSGSDDLTVKVWDIGTGSVRATLRGHKRSIQFVAVTPDGRTVASADSHGVIRLWDALTGRERQRLTGPNEGVFQFLISTDGTTLATAMNDDHVLLWELASGRRQASLDYFTDRCWSLAISPSATLLAWGDRKEGKRLRLFEVPSGKEWPLPVDDRDVAPQTFSADSKTLVVIIHSADLIELREVATGMVRATIPSIDEGHLQALALHPGGRILAVCYQQGIASVRLWDATTGGPAGELPGESQGIDALAFSADGSTLAAAEGPDTAIRVWNVKCFWTATPLAKELSQSELESLWSDLADGDAARAYQAILRLAAAPRQAAALIGRKPSPMAPADPARTAPLIAALGDDGFAVRDAAMRELEAMGDAAGPALTRVLGTRQLLETHHRAKSLLDKLQTLTPDRLQSFRAIEALEQSASAEARQVLEKLAVGVPESRLTQEAKASLQRLTIRKTTLTSNSVQGEYP